MRRRWERLQQLDGALRTGRPGMDRSFTDFHEYYRGAWSIMNDPRVADIFSIEDADRKRYGGSSIGNSLILAFRADAGTRFILASHGGWDHHSDIYKERTRNHPVLIRELDAAFTRLIRDLESTPSRYRPGKIDPKHPQRGLLLGGRMGRLRRSVLRGEVRYSVGAAAVLALLPIIRLAAQRRRRLPPRCCEAPRKVGDDRATRAGAPTVRFRVRVAVLTSACSTRMSQRWIDHMLSM